MSRRRRDEELPPESRALADAFSERARALSDLTSEDVEADPEQALRLTHEALKMWERLPAPLRRLPEGRKVYQHLVATDRLAAIELLSDVSRTLAEFRDADDAGKGAVLRAMAERLSRVRFRDREMEAKRTGALENLPPGLRPVPVVDAGEAGRYVRLPDAAVRVRASRTPRRAVG